MPPLLKAVLVLVVIASNAPAAEVTITGIQPSHSSAKISFVPVPGARDYRIFDVANPLDVKYAGLVHLTAAPGCAGDRDYDLTNTSCYRHLATNRDGSLVFPLRAEGGYGNGGAKKGPTGYDGPAYSIDYNGLGDGRPHTLIVEAVDALGPAPYLNLYRETDIKAFAPLFPGAHDHAHMVMLGGNKGPTKDGRTSTNGQGPYTNNPQAIATSRPFVVQADRNYTPIIAGASQVFLDTFEDASPLVQQPGDCDTYTNDRGDWGGREWTLNAGTDKAWRIIARQIDCATTMPFISSSHFMDVLAERDLTVYGSLSMTPERTFQLNGGILHLTQEVDDVMFGNRWMDFNIAPASDPLVHWNHQDKSLNRGNQWLFMMNFGPYSQFNAQLLIANGPAGNVNTPGAVVNPWTGGVEDLFDPRTLAPNGLGFDNKRRWDFFLSSGWAALFIDGRLVKQGAIPATAWLSTPLKVYFSHYSYHSEAGWKSILSSNQGYGPGFCNMPALAFWFNDAQHGLQAGEQIITTVNGKRIPANGYAKNNCRTSFAPGYGYRNTDERHWDNMGVSVLPASITAARDFSSLAALVQPPKVLKVESAATQPRNQRAGQ